MRQPTALLVCVAAMLGKALGGDGDGDDYYPAPCYSAWAKDPTGTPMCFKDSPDLTTNKWGWNNEIPNQDGTYELELWMNAGQCNVSKGQEIGKVTVVVSGGMATVTYQVSSDVVFAEFHLYVGKYKWHYTGIPGSPTVNPGQFPMIGDYGTNPPGPVDVSNCGTKFFVQAHAKVCEPETPCPPTAAPSLSPIKVPQFTLPPTKLQISFTPGPTAGPSCPIVMTGANGSAPSDSFLDGCGCSEFSCDSPTSPWSDKNYRFCGQCPAYLNGAYHFSCPHCASSGTEVSFTCPNDWEACDVFVEVYSNCATGDTDGGLAYNLASEGWTSGSCGPSFCLSFNDTCQSPPTNAVTQVPETNIKFKLVLFHKQFAGGDAMPIPALSTDPTMYFTFFVKEGHFCSNDKTSLAQCEQTPSVCKWNGATNECFADICPPVVPPPGKGPCCDIAPGVETGNCNAEDTAITSVCDFQVPQCSK